MPAHRRHRPLARRWAAWLGLTLLSLLLGVSGAGFGPLRSAQAQSDDGALVKKKKKKKKKKAPKAKAPKAKARKKAPKAKPPQAAEPQAAEPKAAEPKAAEPKAAEPKAAEPKAAEPKPAVPKATEPEPAAPKPAVPKATAPKPAAPLADDIDDFAWEGDESEDPAPVRSAPTTAPAAVAAPPKGTAPQVLPAPARGAEPLPGPGGSGPRPMPPAKAKKTGREEGPAARRAAPDTARSERLPEPEDRWIDAPQAPRQRVGRPVSEWVYPPQRFRVRFDHGSHVKDQETPCLDCHRSVLGSRAAAERNLPNHLPCQDCHISEDPADIACDQCHGTVPPGRPRPALVPPPHLVFGHRSHLARLLGVPERKLPDLRPAGPLRERRYGEFVKALALPAEVTAFKVSDALCRNCHPNGAVAGADEAVTLPSMQAECFRCHDGQQAPRHCDLCHPEAPDAPLRPGGRSFASLGLRPRSHGQAWLLEHRDEARTQRRDCEGCHHPQDCQTCHEGQVRPAYHPGNWLLSHGLASRSASLECQVCHRLEECSGCHEARKAGPGSFPGTWGAQFHPAGWMTPRSATYHGVAGRRDLLSCTSCHREPDCSRGGCHP